MNPPGPAWLYVPGVLAFADARLFELVGSSLLQAGTLTGLYLLVRLAFSEAAARLAVVLYAFSPIGLFFGSSLWPRGHPFFAVWFVMCVVRWAGERRPIYLASALLTLALGMYVFPELAPLALLVPIVWYLHRPPVAVTSVLAATALCGIVWFPYLRFEALRQFDDVTAILWRTDITPADYHRFWCEPRLREIAPGIASAGAPVASIVAPGRAIRSGLVGNFSHDGLRPLMSSPPTSMSRVRAAVLVIVTLLGLAAVGRRRSAAAGVSSTPWDAQRILALALVVPWMVLLLTTASGRHTLFLWPLQVAFIAFWATDVLGRPHRSRLLLHATHAGLVCLAVATPSVFARLADWQTAGWSGRDPDSIRIVDGLAGALGREGRTDAHIGYIRAGNPIDAAYHAVDARYKAGMEFDYVLEQRSGIRNLDRCPEGVSPADEYRIEWLGGDEGQRPELDRSPFRPVQRFGDYVLLARD